MRVIVTGGRGYADYRKVFSELEKLPREGLVIIQGGAFGADFWAKHWAHDKSVHCLEFKANWALGPVAGHWRNRRMLVEGKPDLVLAFPTPGAENKGTNDMINQAERAAVKTLIIGEQK